MAFKSGKSARLFVAHLHASGYARGFSVDSSTEMLDVATLVDTAKQFIPGQNTSTVSIDMLLDVDGTANLQADTVADWKQSNVPLSFAHDGFARGQFATLVNAVQTSATFGSTLTGVATLAVQAQTTGETDFGYSLVDLAAVTSDTNGASLDNGAASSNGGVAHLHVTAFSGFSGVSVVVEHSSNDSVWATLGTFTTVAGVASERLVVAAGTTVNRYLRVRDDVTGTGSITRQVSFARR